MNRRAALLALLSMPLGYFRAFAQSAGWLTIDLSQWKGIRVKLAGKEVVVSNVEMFEALASVNHEQEEK